MKFWPFIILSAIGLAIWCFILAYIGFLLGPDWDSISGAYNVLTIIVLGAQGLVVFIYIYRKRKKRVTGEDGERKVKVWRGSPNLWLRRSFCSLRKEYGEAIVRGVRRHTLRPAIPRPFRMLATKSERNRFRPWGSYNHRPASVSLATASITVTNELLLHLTSSAQFDCDLLNCRLYVLRFLPTSTNDLPRTEY
jgi:hypothetical protein